MEQERLQARYDQLFKLVYFMRKHQAEFIKFHGSNSLANAKRYESRVDKLLRENLKEDRSLQKSLFE